MNNTHERVNKKLVDRANPDTTSEECLAIAREVETLIKSEEHRNSKAVAIEVTNKRHEASGAHSSKFSHTDKKFKKCRSCGTSHKPKQCPAWGKECHQCKKKNHYAKFCKSSKDQGKDKARKFRKEQSSVETSGAGKLYGNYTYGVIEEVTVHRDNGRKTDTMKESKNKQHHNFSKDVFCDPRKDWKENIAFDEISDSKSNGLHQVITDLIITSEQAKRRARFKLDTGASANLMPLSMWKSIFPQGDKRILEKSREFCTTLTAANETVIKQYGVVHLPVKGPKFTKSCKFYV
ncbi:MAG: hypothetical protein MJA29_02005, partial [Candidatus Omnitrophica bacterium]|nr:hypothetical protein [Candidatus Omnitrophota bacterium]